MSQIDLEQGAHHRRPVTGGSEDMTSGGDGDDSICVSDADDGGSSYSMFYSTAGGGSYDEYSRRFDYVSGHDHHGHEHDNDEIAAAAAACVSDSHRVSSSSSSSSSSVSECSIEVVTTTKVVHLASNVEKDCRICHMSLLETNHESGIAIQLGCSCKDDLAAAHKNCAEQWFKIKGNKTCEICNSLARNVAGANENESADHSNENNNNATTAPVSGPAMPLETRNFWQGHRFLNFMLACMVFAFVISWLFHFNVRS